MGANVIERYRHRDLNASVRNNRLTFKAYVRNLANKDALTGPSNFNQTLISLSVWMGEYDNLFFIRNEFAKIE